jgi:cation transport protein ChaC|tara:strand:- start:1784 stop:2473 length:690 start_codon:yes stop_codon:yes gene_type:complete
MLNRNSIKNGVIYNLLKKNQHITNLAPKTLEERKASLKLTLSKAPMGSMKNGVWVFGYGSLIWNPAIDFIEKRIGRIYGYHRAFCMWTPLGRGTPENPGIMLALDHGGSCNGLAFRISLEKIEEELSILWSREMALDSYIPTWVKIYTDKEILFGLTFTINRNHQRYARQLPTEIIAKHLATAKGDLGTSAEYLKNLITYLTKLDILDKYMDDLHQRVSALQNKSIEKE